MEIKELAVPKVGQGEVLVKVAYAGICGSELGSYLGHSALRVPPLIMGHEFSGEIAALGEGATTLNPRLVTGQKVTVNPLSCAGESELQERGLDQLCPTRTLLGAHRPGAYAEYITVPAQSVIRLPEAVSLRTGALTEPVGCAVRVGELARDVPDKDILIIGAGPIGLLCLQVLRCLEATRVFIVDVNPVRLAMGVELGGEAIDPQQDDVIKAVLDATNGRGVDVSVDAVGIAVTQQQCVSATMATGTVILFGLHSEATTMPLADVIRREIVLRGSYAYSPANFVAALDLLARGQVTLDPWIVEAPLADGGKWFSRLIEAPGNVAKVLLVP
jgi:2-desacetyl-2-hydroxyethyl bacteriochlorophyllide A dehydrogenase